MPRPVVHPASISLLEYVEFFLATSTSDANASRIIVKCDLVYDGMLRFSKVLRGGENKGENAELQVAKDLKAMLGDDKPWAKKECHVNVVVNKSLSIISAEHFIQVYRQLRAKVGQGAVFRVCYAHPCHYVNQRALTNLHRAGIKLQVMAVEDVLREAVKDCISEIRSLCNLDLSKDRKVAIECDEQLLSAAHYLLLGSFQVNDTPLSGHVTSGHYERDAYVIGLRQEMRKLLRSNSKTRSPGTTKKQTVSFDHVNADDVQILKNPGGEYARDKMSDTLLPPTSPHPGHFSSITRSRALLVAKERGSSEVYLGTQTYAQLFLVGKGVTKVSRPKTVDGKWTLECALSGSGPFARFCGLTHKGGFEVGESPLNSVQLMDDVDAEVQQYAGRKDLAFELHLVVASIPDKNNSMRLVVELGESLQARYGGAVSVTSWCAGVDSMNVPTQQAMRRLFNQHQQHTETTDNSSVVDKRVCVLHVADILNFMIDDIMNAFSNFHMVAPERGVNVLVRPCELATAIHLLRSALHMFSVDGNRGEVHRLTDAHVHVRLHDAHHAAKTALLTKMMQDHNNHKTTAKQ